jgi:molybdate transport system substrate-binding protein
MVLGRIVILLCTLVLMASSVCASEIRVSVALSFQDAFEELAASFEQKNKGTKIHHTYGNSQALAMQISSGAPVDLFISAHAQWTDYLKMGRYVDDLLVSMLASNTLVCVGMTGKSASSIRDLRSMKRVGIGNPITTANGQYSMEALKNAGLEFELRNRLVFGNAVENVQRVEMGELDGAIIYRTEAVHLKKAKILFTLLPNLYSPITYQVAIINSSRNAPAVLSFYKYVTSAEAKGILVRHGFIVR